MNYWNLYGSQNESIKSLNKKNKKLKKYLDETLSINNKLNNLVEKQTIEIKKLKVESDILRKDNIALEKKNYETITSYEKKINYMDEIIEKITSKSKKRFQKLFK